MHKHFLMLGQAYIEQLLDNKLKSLCSPVKRCTNVVDLSLTTDECLTALSNGESIKSRYVIGADGARSFVRQYCKVRFELVRPKLIWAVIDGVIKTDFPKVPEIIVFQAQTSDVAWIPREGDIDRFYVRMDTKKFTLEQVLKKINTAITPYKLNFERVDWISQFSVKESVAESFSPHPRVFLTGDACHVHSVNGGQGLNTGLADAFNLIWKINMVLRHNASSHLLKSYEKERKPVAQSVIETSAALVRSTKYSSTDTHAQDYVNIIQKRAGNITGMGIRYGDHSLSGTRLYDFHIYSKTGMTRLYTLLDYTRFTLILFGDQVSITSLPTYIKLIQISQNKAGSQWWTKCDVYKNQALLIRPDSYIMDSSSLNDWPQLIKNLIQEYIDDTSRCYR